MSRRGSRSTDSHYYYDWLEFAAEDLHCADILISAKQCASAAGFHCQQAIEKGIKAYLLYETMSHVDGHNITWLCKSAAKHDEHFLIWLDKTVTLNRLYIETRYPADIPVNLDFDILRGILDMAKEVYDYICNIIYKEIEIDD